MKIAFIQDFWQEYHGLMVLAAVLKAEGCQVDVFIRGEPRIAEKVIKFSPDIIGFSVLTGSHVWSLDFAKRLKACLPQALVVFGGPHPTIIPQMINYPQVDCVAIGEAEETLLELVRRRARGGDCASINGTWFKSGSRVYKNNQRQPLLDINCLPMPYWEMYYKYRFLRSKDQKSFMASRGCVYECAFCSNHVFKAQFSNPSDYLRHREPGLVIEEIRKVKSDLKLKVVTFDDEVFIADKKWLGSFLNLYRREIGLPFFAGVRADLVTEAVMDMLKAAGCYGVSFGVESGSEELRTRVLNKRLSNEQIRCAAGIIKKRNILLRTTSMFGLPDETPEIARRTVYFNREIKVDHPFAYVYTPLPGTRLYEYCKEKGYLAKDFSFNQVAGSLFKRSPVGQEGTELILTAHRLHYYVVRYPGLDFLWRLLLKVPVNFIFDKLFELGLVLNYSRYKKQSLGSILKLAYLTYRNREEDGCGNANG